MSRRTKAEVEAARGKVIAERETVVQRYRKGESMAALCRMHEVDSTWLSERFDEWGEPRRDRSAASVVRGPGVQPIANWRVQQGSS